MSTEELKQKALDVISAGEGESIADFFVALSDFKKHATAPTILALIAGREELLAKLDRAQSEIRALESKLLEREVRS